MTNDETQEIETKAIVFDEGRCFNCEGTGQVDDLYWDGKEGDGYVDCEYCRGTGVYLTRVAMLAARYAELMITKENVLARDLKIGDEVVIYGEESMEVGLVTKVEHFSELVDDAPFFTDPAKAPKPEWVDGVDVTVSLPNRIIEREVDPWFEFPRFHEDGWLDMWFYYAEEDTFPGVRLYDSIMM